MQWLMVMPVLLSCFPGPVSYKKRLAFLILGNKSKSTYGIILSVFGGLLTCGYLLSFHTLGGQRT